MAIGVLAFVALVGMARADDSYPNRAIRIIIPYAPGGGADAVIRYMSDKLTEKLGQQIIIENRPGASGFIGAQVVASSPPDGYVLLMGFDGGIVVAPHLMKAPFDPLRDFVPVTKINDATLVLAANDQVAAGLLIQRLPLQGEANLAGHSAGGDEDNIGLNEDYNRISILSRSLTAGELLTLDADEILHRLFWEEKVLRYPVQSGERGPRFACSCSRERVSRMLLSLGRAEADSIIAERQMIEVGCDFCGKQYAFDAVDAERIFRAAAQQPPVGDSVH